MAKRERVPEEGGLIMRWLSKYLLGPAHVDNALHGGTDEAREQWKRHLEARKRYAREERERKRAEREARRLGASD